MTTKSRSNTDEFREIRENPLHSVTGSPELDMLIVSRRGIEPVSMHIRRYVTAEEIENPENAYILLNQIGVDQICEAILHGIKLATVAEAVGVSLKNLMSWLRADPKRNTEFERAKRDKAYVLREDAIEYASHMPKSSLQAKHVDTKVKTLLSVARDLDPPDKQAAAATVRVVFGFDKPQTPKAPKVIEAKPAMEAVEAEQQMELSEDLDMPVDREQNEPVVGDIDF